MTMPSGDIDWEVIERRERRRDLLAALVLIAFFAGLVLLTGRFGFWTGGAAWTVVGLFVALFLGLLALAQLSPWLRARTAAGYRILAALRQHLDPGPELRTRTDRQARYVAGTGWVAWCGLIGPLCLLGGGQWDRPAIAAMGAVLVLGAAVSWTRWLRGRRDAARRWLAEPPGPVREAPPVTAVERWSTGRRGLLAILGAVVALVLVGSLVAVIAVRS